MVELFRSLAIENVQVSEQDIGRGAYAEVKEAKWRGLNCAGKRIHGALCQDLRTNKVIEGFLEECRVWSSLRHPHIVQFLGLYFERDRPLPMLIMERMDISLRFLLERYKKDTLPFYHKINILFQVCLALTYLHLNAPPLVHRDLTANNVLLNLRSLSAKITDFGMVKVLDLTKAQNLTGIPGAGAYMPPEAFGPQPVYTTKLDVFSFGILTLHAVVHEWPDPLAATQYCRGSLRALTEFERRETYIRMFSDVEREYLLPVVISCLQNQPEARPEVCEILTHLEEIRSKPNFAPVSVNLLELEDERLQCFVQLQSADERIQHLERLQHSGSEPCHSTFKVSYCCCYRLSLIHI